MNKIKPLLYYIVETHSFLVVHRATSNNVFRKASRMKRPRTLESVWGQISNELTRELKRRGMWEYLYRAPIE